jgi:energy-converting hydrogenase Eha subunit E
MIRFAIGFVIAYAAVGTLEADPHASLITQSAIAAVGVILMFLGVNKLTKNF